MAYSFMRPYPMNFVGSGYTSSTSPQQNWNQDLNQAYGTVFQRIKEEPVDLYAQEKEWIQTALVENFKDLLPGHSDDMGFLLPPSAIKKEKDDIPEGVPNYDYVEFSDDVMFTSLDEPCNSVNTEDLFEWPGLEERVPTSDKLTLTNDHKEPLEFSFDDLEDFFKREPLEIKSEDFLPKYENENYFEVVEPSSFTLNMENYMCTKCPYTTNTRESLSEHIIETHSLNSVNNGPLSSRLQRGKPMKEAFSAYKGKTSFAEQQRKPYFCMRCSYDTNRYDRLEKHIRTQHSDNSTSFYNDYVSAGFNTVHSDIKVKRKPSPRSSKKSLKCSQCTYKTPRNDRLKKHVEKIHSKNICYSCNLCHFQSTYNREYYEHMRKHYRGPPFICANCSYSSRLITAFIAHRVTHTGDRIFKCTLCPFSCKRKYHLKSHMVSHTKIKKFSCMDCSKKYRYKCSLVRHLRTSCKGKNGLTFKHY